MAFVTYLYLDPKTSVPRYVGKGLENRPLQHLTNPARAHHRLRRMLQKRIREGFEPKPIIIAATTEADAFEMEELLIAMIGRLDLGLGPLFNNTNGGEGETGRIVPIEVRQRTSRTFHGRSEAEKDKTFQLLSAHKKSMWAKMSSEEKRELSRKQAESKNKPCTLDGVKIFSSRNAMIAELGQGKTGTRASTFRYI
jgi:hypothetical protein